MMGKRLNVVILVGRAAVAATAIDLADHDGWCGRGRQGNKGKGKKNGWHQRLVHGCSKGMTGRRIGRAGVQVRIGLENGRLQAACYPDMTAQRHHRRQGDIGPDPDSSAH